MEACKLILSIVFGKLYVLSQRNNERKYFPIGRFSVLLESITCFPFSQINDVIYTYTIDKSIATIV